MRWRKERDEVDQPGSPRVARAADLDRDIDFQSSDVRAIQVEDRMIFAERTLPRFRSRKNN